jgi:hypothetical protein
MGGCADCEHHRGRAHWLFVEFRHDLDLSEGSNFSRPASMVSHPISSRIASQHRPILP